jgi:hypothetical protein
MLLSTLKISPEEVAGGGAAVPERVEHGTAEVEGTSMVITGATGNWGLRLVISMGLEIGDLNALHKVNARDCNTHFL